MPRTRNSVTEVYVFTEYTGISIRAIATRVHLYAIRVSRTVSIQTARCTIAFEYNIAERVCILTGTPIFASQQTDLVKRYSFSILSLLWVVN
jgi:hypothetical protein